MIDGKKFFDQLLKKDFITYENTRKIATVREDDYTTGCLPVHNYFKNYCYMITID